MQMVIHSKHLGFVTSHPTLVWLFNESMETMLCELLQLFVKLLQIRTADKSPTGHTSKYIMYEKKKHGTNTLKY